MTSVLYGILVFVTASICLGVPLRVARKLGFWPKLTSDQLSAVSKRIADALEKLSIGSFLYWFFQNQWSGLFLGIIVMAVSLVITIKRS